MGLVVPTFGFGVGSSSQPKVAPPMHHVHREGMVFAEEETKLIHVASHVLALETLPPVSQPATVDLPSEDHALALERPDVNILLF